MTVERKMVDRIKVNLSAKSDTPVGGQISIDNVGGISRNNLVSVDRGLIEFSREVRKAINTSGQYKANPKSIYSF